MMPKQIIADRGKANIAAGYDPLKIKTICPSDSLYVFYLFAVLAYMPQQI